MAEDNSKHLNKPFKGLYTDSTPNNQPEGTYPFALNAVHESNEGEGDMVSNEMGNIGCAQLPSGYIPIGSVYVGDGNTVIFSVSPTGIISEIGINDKDCNYDTLVNCTELGFRVDNQIDATYRLRRGCERTIYFVDGHNKPRLFNIDRPDSFVNAEGGCLKSMFELQRTYSDIPVFTNIEVLNSGGKIEPGSLNFVIQYLDQDFNPAEWIRPSPVVNIYNDSLTNSYLDINGSINSEDPFRDFPVTNKSVNLTLGNLDESFLFYRVAIIEANTGTGNVSAVKFSAPIPTTKEVFIYTGENYETTGTLEEIAMFSDIIETAEHIDQLDNMLLLANVKGNQAKFCNLQRFASKIRTDLFTKKVYLNSLGESSPKSPTVNVEGTGYMPNEIYSLGIVWVFEDSTISPVYHIPGKNPTLDDTTVFEPGDNTYPMSTDNQASSDIYTDNNTCNNVDYWGMDSEGEYLKGKPVRHHRFPKRSDLNIPLVKKEESQTNTVTTYKVKVEIAGDIPTPCTQEDVDAGYCPEIVVAEPFRIEIKYTVDGEEKSFYIDIDPSDYFEEDSLYTLEDFIEFSDGHTSDDIVITGIEEDQADGTTVSVDPALTDPSPRGLTYTTSVSQESTDMEYPVYYTEIFGLKFSNVELPTKQMTGGKQVVGYYIVRNERTDEHATVLDSAVLTPCLANGKYTGSGIVAPYINNTNRIHDGVMGLITPEHKFNGKNIQEYTEVVQDGEFNINQRLTSYSRYLDVSEGSSHDGDNHKGDDDDGWSLKLISRDNIVSYKNKIGDYDISQENIKTKFYLNSMESRAIDDGATHVFNTSADNKMGYVHTEPIENSKLYANFPYVYLKRHISNPYSTFRTLPYYHATTNMQNSSTSVVFGGDVYVTPMRYNSTVFWDNRQAKRAVKRKLWKIIAGAALVIVGVVSAVFTGGLSALAVGAGISLIGGGALLASSGFRKEAWNKMYLEEYEKGLRTTVQDYWVEQEYLYHKYSKADTPEDDEIQWIGDCVTDFWFESKVNMSLRYKMFSGEPSFLDAPGIIESGRTGNEPTRKINVKFSKSKDVHAVKDRWLNPIRKLDQHIMDKLTVFNPDREHGRMYIGHPLGEWYAVNPDHQRMNKEKFYTHLPIEYDCCSKCEETFTQRLRWTLQAFQEERTDNYRIFLPNNYRDIEGETGEITNIFTWRNNLFVHTEEALWHLPQNYQERITGDIVSFIGTGEYFSTPPRPMVDSEHSSAGSTHKWATIKTPNGVVFVSEKERSVYLFDGKQLNKLNIGMENWFKNDAKLFLMEEFYKQNKLEYPFNNNPSSLYGIGFISAFDSRFNRLLVSKKDFSNEAFNVPDSRLTYKDGTLMIFLNYQETIDQRVANGWRYLGIQNGEMVFERDIETVVQETRQRVIPGDECDPGFIPVVIDGISYCERYTEATADYKGDAFIGPGVQELEAYGVLPVRLYGDILDSEFTYPFTLDDLYADPAPMERYIEVGTAAHWVTKMDEGNIRLYKTEADVLAVRSDRSESRNLSRIEATNNEWWGFTSCINVPTSKEYYVVINADNYVRYYVNGMLLADLFVPMSNTMHTRIFQAPHIFKIKLEEGDNIIEVQTSNLGESPAMFFSEIYEATAQELIGNEWLINGIPEERIIFSTKDLRNQTPIATVHSGVGFGYECPSGMSLSLCGEPKCIKLERYTASPEIIIEETVDVTKLDIEVHDIDPTPLENSPVNKSWTMSFSFKKNAWMSWHSYLPSFYFDAPEQFFSWVHGNDNIWKHNKQGLHHNYYGENKPFIIEHVSLSQDLRTKITEDIMFHTEAKRYSEPMQEYFDEKEITFNKGIFYNTRQCSGLLELQAKNNETSNYILDQVMNINPGTIVLDKNEKNWTLNDIRDIRIDYSQPIFKKDGASLQDDYYIDKILNETSLDFEKDWQELESFRDKFLVVRLIFDNFDDVKLLMNFSVETKTVSE